jgi:hypothetical protein
MKMAQQPSRLNLSGLVQKIPTDCRLDGRQLLELMSGLRLQTLFLMGAIMVKDEIDKLYESMIVLLDEKQLDNVYVVIANVIADTAYTHNLSLIRVLGAINATALAKYGELVNEEETSTKQ